MELDIGIAEKESTGKKIRLKLEKDDYGVVLKDSENVLNLVSFMNDGIFLNNSNRHIIAQNILSNNARYGINLDTVLYSNIGNNTCNSNLMGIYVLDSSNNSPSFSNLAFNLSIYSLGKSFPFSI